MAFRQQTRIGSPSAGYTLIELLEGIAAIALGGWLATKVSSHLEGTWRVVVYWAIVTAGSGIIFVSLLLGFGYLLDIVERRRRAQKTSDGKTQDAV